jgi:hypothetical protein
MCHRVNAENATRCDCAYEFGQPVDNVLELLRDQHTRTWITLVFSILALAASLVGLFFLPFFGMFLFGGTFLWTGRMARKLWITRASLKQLGDRKLPEARLLKD